MPIDREVNLNAKV